MKLKELYRNSRFYYLYNRKDQNAFGRLILITCTAVANLASILTTGLFYTGFLIDNGINLTSIGIISFVPPITSCFTLFASVLLERFKKRKWVLVGGRMLYYTFYVLGGTLVPMFVHDPTMKVVCFVITVFLGHSCNAMTSSGFSAWHINFIPDDVRAEHLGINNLIANISSTGFGMIFALIADAFADTPGQSTLFVVLRFVAYGVGLLDCILYSLPHEYPYVVTGAKPQIKNVFSHAFSNKKFLGCILLLCCYTFATNLPASVLNYRLLEELQLSYSYMQFINVLYPIFVFSLMIPCQFIIKKIGWLETMSLGMLMDVFSFAAYGFVTPENANWLFPTVRLAQHVSTALFTGIPLANLHFFNLPDENRTDYLSFYILANNAAAFLGLMCGTWFVAAAPNFLLRIFGVEIGNIQFLLLMQSAMLLVTVILTLRNRKRLRPSTM